MILIIDFGSQYNQLIARRVQENNVYCLIEPPAIKVKDIRRIQPEGIILSGGPSSIYEKSSPKIDPAVFNLSNSTGAMVVNLMPTGIVEVH